MVAAAAFSNARRWRKKIAGEDEWTEIRSFEWVRYASLAGTRVAGGMGKVLNRFVKDLSPDDTLRFSVVVSNTGDMDGAEVVQVYVRDVNASVSRPVRELKDFEKVFLGKGESRKINFSVPVRSFSMYDIGMRKVVEPGRFDVFVGNSSEAGLSFSVNVGN